jgi:hypothetical protein
MKAASVGWIWVWGRASVSGRTRFGKGKMESGRSLTRGRKVNPAHLVSVDPWHVKHGTFFEKKKGHILLVTTGSRMFISQRTQPASASRYVQLRGLARGRVALAVRAREVDSLGLGPPSRLDDRWPLSTSTTSTCGRLSNGGGGAISFGSAPAMVRCAHKHRHSGRLP